MKKNTILKIINPILLVLVINQVITGWLHIRLSPKTFEFLHEGTGKVLLVLAVVHLILNFNWVKVNYFKKK